MIFTLKQKKEAYNKLSLEMQDFVMSNEMNELIENILKEIKLPEDQLYYADREILYAMLRLQSLSTAISNIATISGKSVNDLSKLKSELEEKIFNKIKKETVVEEPKDNFISKLEGNKSKADRVRQSGDQKEIQEKLKQLSSSLQAYINGGVWKQSVSKIGGQLNLKPDQMPKLENEVFLVLICLEPPSDFVENVKREVGVEESTARTVSNYINGTVFGVVMKEIKEAWAPNNSSKQSAVSSQDEKEWSKPNLANMAKAMGVDMPPDNLPVENSSKQSVVSSQEENRVVHDYVAKSDPYRELPE